MLGKRVRCSQASSRTSFSAFLNAISKRRKANKMIALAVMLCLSTGASAQDAADVHIVPRPSTHLDAGRAAVMASADGSEPALLSVQVDLVLVPVMVTDTMHRPMLGLNKRDFAIYEDDKKQEIRYFSTEDRPISVGIVLDLSGTMANKVDELWEAFDQFFQNCNPEDDYFLITFADRPELIADTTHSFKDIRNSLALAKPTGHTALLDAVHMGLQKLRTARYDRRALLIISDGGDNWSRHKLREMEKEVEESDVDVYALGLFNDEIPVLSSFEVTFGKRLLRKLTDASGGHAVMVSKSRDLESSAAELAREMRSHYVLGYKPTSVVKDGEKRKIKVRVESTPGGSPPYYLAYKKGYNAPLH